MAELMQNQPKGIAGRNRTVRIDLTPMVDLAFLLITFFMLTTNLAKPQIMPVVMPEKEVEIDQLKPTPESQVLTLLLGAQDKVYYYEGIENPRLDSTDYASDGLRLVILDKKARVDAATKKEADYSKTVVLIKPTEHSRYKNIVDVFDEMKICGIASYMLLDVSPQELAFLKQPASGLDFSPEDQAKAID
jgi:biopolymer transport protein ExbD